MNRIPKPFRITRFIRITRDLVVSGYYYHLRGAVPWFRKVGPDTDYWKPINGCIPKNMPADLSYAQYLQGLPLEEGLLAEIEFRTHHFQSMREWPEDDKRIRLYKYEHILGRETTIFSDMFRFYEFPLSRRLAGIFWAWHYSAKRQGRRSRHIRNPASGQWRSVFTPNVKAYFHERYGDLIERYDYPVR